MKKAEKSKLFWLKISGVCVLGVVIFAIILTTLNSSYSIVMLDVNPSIELRVNDKNRIVDYTYKNEDAKNILDGMDLKDTDIIVGLTAIIGSMVRNGYIDELANSVLVSVKNEDVKKVAELEDLLVSEINNILTSANIQGSIIGITLSDEDNLDNVADINDISVGKAKLITELVQANNLLSVSELAKLSINELNLLLDTYTINVNKVGNASSESYIGESEAKNIALTHANVDNPTSLKIEFDLDDGVMVYEVEFYSGNIEYDYEINAVTGAVIEYNKDGKDGNIQNDNVSSDYITKEGAKNIALTHAGVNPSYVEIEFDFENGIAVYEINFEYDGYEYEYEIDATSGDILKNKKERD